MLQQLRMGIQGNLITEISAFVFVQTDLGRDDLPPIEYTNAEDRANEAVGLFRDDLKIDPEKIKVCKNYSKQQILQLFDQMQDQSDSFEIDHETDKHVVNAVIVLWIGFCLSEQNHPYIEDFEDIIDDSLYPPFFPLTKTGEPVPVSQLLLRLSDNNKTKTIFLQDDQAQTRKEPTDCQYIDQSAGFNDYVYLKDMQRGGQQALNEIRQSSKVVDQLLQTTGKVRNLMRKLTGNSRTGSHGTSPGYGDRQSSQTRGM